MKYREEKYGDLTILRLIKCRYADKYKALRAPTCGCDTCKQKWESRK